MYIYILFFSSDLQKGSAVDVQPNSTKMTGAINQHCGNCGLYPKGDGHWEKT